MTAPRALLLLAGHNRKPYRAGQHRRIQAGRIRVVDVQELQLRDITHDQARLLGHRGTAAFKRDWLAGHDQAWLSAWDRGDNEQLARFDARWGRRWAELVTYTHVAAPELLADVRCGHGDYTTSPSRTIDREAGCVDEATLRQYALRAVATRDSFRAALEAARAQDKAERGREQREAA